MRHLDVLSSPETAPPLQVNACGPTESTELLDASGRPTDWATEIWSGRDTNRPGSGGNLLAAEALPDPTPHRPLPSRSIRLGPAPATASRSTIFPQSASRTD
jgi:hypothetical protein